jgi:hypothetical protein
MKQKLRIDQLKVQSFLTSADADAHKGGATLICNTNASCLPYVTCDRLQCIIASEADPCYKDLLTTG